MRLLFASSEVYPFSKTGGLADVAGALPQALAALGVEVLVVTPWYRTLRGERAPLWIGDIDIPFDGAHSPVGLGTLEQDGVRYVFVGHADFDRGALYGYDDDAKRFARFTRAIPAAAHRVGFRPDLVHVNDWHTAYLPMVLAHGWHLPAGFIELPSLLTIHNIQHQGPSGLDETLYWLRLPGALKDSWMNHFGAANAMQAGLGFAWRVTTVSPSYAEEIQHPEFGFGLDGTLRHIADKVSGILNGLDTEVWDPERDPLLPTPYSAADLGGKAVAKRELCARFGLDPAYPLIGVVSRLADQKGLDLLLEAVPGLAFQGWSLALLGSGEPELERRVYELAAERPERFGGHVGYDEALAHLVYAGSDALAIPSRFEPCGLSQLIAMRYGTVPIARETGGLRDTIDHGRTGFLFSHASAAAIYGAAGEARARFGTPAWAAMMRAGMAEDFSWRRSAERYLELYRSMIGRER